MSLTRKIPIPSFAPPAASIETKNGASERMRLAINEESMMRLENALQLHLHQQKQQIISSDNPKISFSDFSRMSSKVETSSSNDETKSSNETEIPSASDLWNLSRAERFWHDLYCVAVPALYHTNDSMENKENDNSASPRKKRRRLAAIALELTPRPATELESKNRVGELRRLVREAKTRGVPKSKSAKALGLLKTLKQEKEKENEPTRASNKDNGNKRPTNSLVDSLLRDASTSTNHDNGANTTIDERIRARAKERERNLEQAKAARKDPREERVAIADALYSYASHILRRKQSRRFQNKAKSNSVSSSKKCVVSFHEIVHNGLPNRSRKEIGRIMSDIVTVLSDSGSGLKFLKWKDLKTDKAYGIPISKNATVTIDTSNFKTVRETLNKEKRETTKDRES